MKVTLSIQLETCNISFQQLPVVPLFGDMQISLVAYVKQCPHFELSKWSCAAERAEEKAGVSQYNLINRMGQIHEEHLKIISELARYSNEVSMMQSHSKLVTYMGSVSPTDSVVLIEVLNRNINKQLKDPILSILVWRVFKLYLCFITVLYFSPCSSLHHQTTHQ